MTKLIPGEVAARLLAALVLCAAPLVHADLGITTGLIDYASITPGAASSPAGATPSVPPATIVAQPVTGTSLHPAAALSFPAAPSPAAGAVLAPQSPLPAIIAAPGGSAAGLEGARAESYPIGRQRNLLPASDLLSSSDLLPATDLLRAPETADALNPALTDPRRLADESASYADLWERIRDGFSMAAVDNGRVIQQVEWFETHQSYVDRLVERSRKYLFFIVEEVQKRGMPTEVALLPIVESAFNPVAISPAKASGIWQFMPATGKAYGMRQNWWYDGRRDIVAATNGALDYLEKLHTQFGTWDLALAAYNCGEGAVARAVERNQRAGRPTDYASLNLPEETRNYVPKLLAAREIVADPAAHGLILPTIADAPYFAVVTTNKHVDLAVAAKFANLNVDDFLALNPGYNRPVILAQGEQTILVPVDIAEAFTARLNDPEARLVSWRPHRLRRGENLASVASRFGMSSDELKRINGISALRRVAGGGTILVRDAHADEGDLDALMSNAPAEAELAAPTQMVTFSHRVKRGESLASVARRYNVSVASLRTWNRIPLLRAARTGQLLVMHRTTELDDPEAAAAVAASEPAVPATTQSRSAAPVYESALVTAAARAHHGRGHRGRAGHGNAGAHRAAVAGHGEKSAHATVTPTHATSAKPAHLRKK